MAKVDIPQLMIRWQKNGFSRADLQVCLAETMALTEELSDLEKMAPERARQLADELFKVMRGGFKERLTTLFALDLRAVQFRPCVSEESSKLEETQEPWDSDNCVGLNDYQIKNKGGIIDVIQALARTLKPYETRDHVAAKYLGESRCAFDSSLVQAQLQRGVRAPWRKSYLDLLPADIKGLNVKAYPPSKWLSIAGAMSPDYHRAVVREINRLPFESNTIEALGIQNGLMLIEFLRSYGSGLQRLNLSDCEFVTDEHVRLLAECPHLRELDLTGCDKLTDQGIKILGTMQHLITLLHPQRDTIQSSEHLRGLVNLQRFRCEFCDDALLENLAACTHLRDLELYFCTGITDAGFKAIGGLTCLEELDLSITNDFGEANVISESGCEQLARLTNLRYLNLGDRAVTDGGFQHFKRLENLQVLIMDGNQITDTGLRHLGGLHHLRKIDFHFRSNAQMTFEGIAWLMEKFPKIDMSLGSSRK